jgi:hypothetical protein
VVGTYSAHVTIHKMSCHRVDVRRCLSRRCRGRRLLEGANGVLGCPQPDVRGIA